MSKHALAEAADKRILILDSAMGTMIQLQNLGEEDYRGERFKDFPDDLKGNNDLLSLTQPEIIKNIHLQNLEAGADLIETNTFNANQISLSDYNMEDLVAEINKESARLAREAADELTEKDPARPRFVVGTMGPTTKTASLSPDVNNPGYRAIDFDGLYKIYREQAEALMDGGVDALLVETIFDTLNAKAALFALEDLFEDRGEKLPIMVSGTITDASGRTLSGQTTEAFWVSISHVDLFSVGLNCALGADQLRPYMQRLSNEADCYTSAHPNAGLPNAFGEYDQDPEEMVSQIKEYLDLGLVNIIGGCCGTTPEHIKAIAELTKDYEPRNIKEAVADTAESVA